MGKAVLKKKRGAEPPSGLADRVRRQLVRRIEGMDAGKLLRLAGEAESEAPIVDPGEVQFQLSTPGGFGLTKTVDGDICPARWDETFMVYPRRAMVVNEHPLDFISEEQWEVAVRMLAEGYVIGFNGGNTTNPDIACTVAMHCQFPLTALRDPVGNDVVFFSRRVDGPPGAVKGKKQ